MEGGQNAKTVRTDETAAVLGSFGPGTGGVEASLSVVVVVVLSLAFWVAWSLCEAEQSEGEALPTKEGVSPCLIAPP